MDADTDSSRHPREWQGRPCVYYVRRDNRIKIGWTANLESRMRRLEPCEILAVEPVPVGRKPQEWETRRHNQFSAERIRGEREREWFRPSPRLGMHIAEMARAHPVPVMPPRVTRRRRLVNSGITLFSSSTDTFPPEVPPEHETEVTGPVTPIPPDALPLPRPIPNDDTVPSPWLQRMGVKRFPRPDGLGQPTYNRGQMARHWPVTTVALAIFTGVMMQTYGWYAVPIGLAVLIISFLIGERLTSRAAVRHRSAAAKRSIAEYSTERDAR